MIRFIALLVSVLLIGCSPLVQHEQTQDQGSLLIEPGDAWGQTFLARYDGLNGVALLLKVPEEAGEIEFRLLPEAASSEVLASTTVDLTENQGRSRLEFPFSPQTESAKASYYAELVYFGEEPLGVFMAGSDAYLYGAAYRNRLPLENQLNFSLSYDPVFLAVGLLMDALGWGLTIGLLAVIMVLPGWGLLLWSWPGFVDSSWTLKFTLSISLSIAFYPVLMIWTYWLGLNLGIGYAFIPPILGGGLILVYWLSKRGKPTGDIDEESLPLRQQFLDWIRNSSADLTLILGLVLIVLIRFWAIRLLEAPLWGDSYQHTMIAQLILDNHGLFQSWAPYEPFQSLSVHVGFPALTAVYAWLSGSTALQGALVTGQAINIAAVLAVYPLAFRLSRGRRWAATSSVLVAGLISQLPALYLNWGRYPQLLGLAILPAALWFFWDFLEMEDTTNRERVSSLVILGIVLAGMVLSYYRMPFFFASFAAILLLFWGIPRYRGQTKSWMVAAVRCASVVAAGLLFFGPWIPRLLGSQLADFSAAPTLKSVATEGVLADLQAWLNVPNYYPPGLVALAILGFVIAAIRRNWMIAALALWMILIGLYTIGQLAGFPASNMIRNFTVVIALYIPIAISAGYLAAEIIQVMEAKATHPLRVSWAAAVILILGSAYIASRNPSVNPQKYALVVNPDLKAMAWIRENTPPDSKFLVEGFAIYDRTSAVGADAGWWIPLLADRRNSMPPQYPLISETANPPDYSQQVVELVNQVADNGINTGAALVEMCRQGITHIYMGQRQGLVGDAPRQLFSADELADNPAFEPVYAEDLVRIYELNPDICR